MGRLLLMKPGVCVCEREREGERKCEKGTHTSVDLVS